MTGQSARHAHEPAFSCSTETPGPDCARRHYARATAALHRSRLSGFWQCTAAGRATVTALADLPPLCDRIDRLNRSRRRHQDLWVGQECRGDPEPLAHAERELPDALAGNLLEPDAVDHLVDGVLKGHASAVLAASIFHFGEFTIRQAKERMAAAGIPMRMD